MDNLAKEHWIVYVDKSRWFSPSYYVYCSRCFNGGLHMDATTGEPIVEDFCTYCDADMREKEVEWKILSEQGRDDNERE